jgi:hypothetical protein
MTILAQSFFTLVRCHLVAFTFLSVWHSRKMLYEIYNDDMIIYGFGLWEGDYFT